MIGNAILGEIIGSDPLATIARAHLAALFLGNLIVLLGLGLLQEASPENL